MLWRLPAEVLWCMSVEPKPENIAKLLYYRPNADGPWDYKSAGVAINLKHRLVPQGLFDAPLAERSPGQLNRASETASPGAKRSAISCIN